MKDRGTGRRKLISNIFALYILQGLNYIIPLAVLPYLVRTLGMERYGLVALSQSFAQYFILFSDYGFNYSATRSIAKQRDDSIAVSGLFCTIILIKLVLAGLGFAILIAIIGLVRPFQANSAFFFVAYLAVIGNVLFPVWYYQGIEQMRYISIIIGISRFIGAIALFVFVHHPQDALLSLTIQSVTPIVGGVAGLWVIFHKFKVRFVWPAPAQLKSALMEGWHLFVSTAAISLYTNTNVFLVGLLAGNLQAGYFSAAEKLLRGMQGLITPITQAIFPHINSLAAKSRDNALQFTARILRWMSAFSLTASLLVFVYAKPLVTICFGHLATESVPIVRWIAFLPFLIVVSNVLGVQIMVSFGLDKQFSRILIFAGLFNLALAIPLIKMFAARGAGASVLVTEFLVTVLMVVVLRHYNIRVFSPAGVTA